MNENLADALMRASDALHWLGQWQISNACILLARLLRAKKIEDLDEFETFVQGIENEQTD